MEFSSRHLSAASPYEAKPTVFSHRAGHGMNPMHGLSFSPKSGRVVEYLGSYNPHTKAVSLDKERTSDYLKNGAQPSPRVSKLLKDEGIKLPSWVTKSIKKKGSIRNPEKLRRNRPDEPAAAEIPAPEAEALSTETEAPAEPAAENQVEEAETTEPETVENQAPAQPDPTPQAPPPDDAQPDTPGPAKPDEAENLPSES